MDTKIKQDLKINSKQIILLSNLFLNKDYPYCFITIKQAKRILDRSRATVKNLLDDLVSKGYVTKQRAYITFYYPIEDKDIRKQILKRLGFLK